LPNQKTLYKAISVSLAILFFISASGQNKKSIEFSLIGRYDQENFVTNFGGRGFNDTLKLYGISYGATISYRQKIHKDISASVGIGYFRLGIDKIKGSSPFSGIPGARPRTSRAINYDDGSSFLYSTSKYYYNNLLISIELSKTRLINNNLYFDIAAEGTGYYSVSQRYYQGSKSYSTNNRKPLEFGANITTGVFKAYKKIYIRPALIIPVYKNLKGDVVFYEDRNMNFPNWFKGMGLKLRVGKYF